MRNKSEIIRWVIEETEIDILTVLKRNCPGGADVADVKKTGIKIKSEKIFSSKKL